MTTINLLSESDIDLQLRSSCDSASVPVSSFSRRWGRKAAQVRWTPVRSLHRYTSVVLSTRHSPPHPWSGTASSSCGQTRRPVSPATNPAIVYTVGCSHRCLKHL